MIAKQHLRFVLEGHVPRTDDKDKEEYSTKENMAHIDDFSHHSMTEYVRNKLADSIICVKKMTKHTTAL